MPDSQDEYRIKIVVDPSAGTAGVNQSVADLDREKQALTDATAVAQRFGISIDQAKKVLIDMAREDQAAKLAAIKNELRGATQEAQNLQAAATGTGGEISRLGEVGGRAGQVLGSMRNAHHALAGIMELAMGGTAALGGLAMEGRVATEVFDSMLGPLAPLLLTITTLTALAIPIFEKWEEHEQKIAEGKGGVDDYAQKWKDASDEICGALDQIRAAQDEVAKQDERDLAAIKEKQRVLDEEAKLQEKRDLQALQEKYIAAESAPGVTEEERKRLKEQYEAGKQDIKDKTTVNAAQADVNAKQEDYDKLHQVAVQQQKEKDDAQKVLDHLEQIQQDAHSYIDGLGLKPDKDGKITNAQGEDEVVRLRKEASDAREQVAITKADYGNVVNAGQPGASPIEKQQGEAARQQIADREKEAQLAEAKYQNLLAAGNNFNRSADLKKAQENLDKGKADLSQTEENLKSAVDNLHLASEALPLARNQAALDKSEREAQQAIVDQRAEQEKLRKARDNELEASKLALQAQLDKAPEAAKPGIHKKLNDLENQGTRNKEADAVETPIRPPAPPSSTITENDPQITQLKERIRQLEAQRSAEFNRGPPDADRQAIASILQTQIASLATQIEKIISTKTIPELPAAAPTADDLYKKSVHDKADAQVNESKSKTDATVQKEEVTESKKVTTTETHDAKAALVEAQQAAAAAEKAHPELMKGVKGLSDAMARNAQLTLALATSIDPALRAVGQRLQAAEDKITTLQHQTTNLNL